MSDGTGTQEKQKAAKVKRKPEHESILRPTFAASRHSSNSALWDRNQQESGLLQRECACGTHTIAGDVDDTYHEKQDSSFLQQNAINTESNAVLNNPDEIRTIPKAGFAQDFSQIPVYSKSSPPAIQTTLFPASSGNQDKQKSPEPSLPKDAEATVEAMSDLSPDTVLAHLNVSNPAQMKQETSISAETVQLMPSSIIQRVPFRAENDQRVLQGGRIDGTVIQPCQVDLQTLMRLYSLGVDSISISVTNPDGNPQTVRFTRAWATTHAGRAILRGRIRHQIAGIVRNNQAPTLRRQISGLAGDTGRIADLRTFLSDAETRASGPAASGRDVTASSAAIVDEAYGTGSNYVCRGYGAQISIQEPVSSAAECARVAARRGIRMRLHAAVDLAGPENTGVYAPLAGVVLNSYNSSSYGNVVRIHHPNAPETTAGPHRRSRRWNGREVITSYCHLSASLVETGQAVFPGQAIGLLGNTGTASRGPHVHFSVQAVFNGRLPLQLTTNYENQASLRPTHWFTEVSGSPTPYRAQVPRTQRNPDNAVSGVQTGQSVQPKRISSTSTIQRSAFSDPEIDQRQPAEAANAIQRLVIQRVTDAQRYENTLTNAGTTRAAWDSGYSSATFLGVNIARGIHQELANRLTLAETYLRGQFPGRTDAQIATEIGLYSISGRRAVTNAVGGSRLSLHSFGLAIDVNYRGNPFIGRSEEVAQIIDRISQFMTGNAFNIRTRQRGTPEEIRARFETVSDAFANYFRMRGDRDLIRAHLASRGEVIGMSPNSDLINPWQAEDDARIQQVFDQIEADATNQALLDDMEMTGVGPRPLASGFIDLSEQLVEALSNQAGLFWGALYSTGKDIMHFDWRTGTIQDSHRE